MLAKDSAVLIATFSIWRKGVRSAINGNVDPMLDFFRPRVGRVTLIDQPYPSSDFVMPRIEDFNPSSTTERVRSSSLWLHLLVPVLKLRNTDATHISFKIRDFLSVIDWGLRQRSKYEYFIGFEAINAIAGMVLRRLGIARRVIYYVSDYSPRRYKNKWFNTLYLAVDRFAAMRADYIWDVSKAMQPARIGAGLDPKRSAPVLNVPNALYPAQISQGNAQAVIPRSMVFMGTLGAENGPDLAIETLRVLLSTFTDATLHIIGGGEQNVARLSALARKAGVTDNVIFHGFINDRIELSDTLRKFAVAVAPYRAIPGGYRNYADATKIRAYLGAGLPVVTTFVPPLGIDVEAAGAALRSDDTPEAQAAAITRIFADDELFRNMREHAIEFARHNTWENEFNKAFEDMAALNVAGNG